MRRILSVLLVVAMCFCLVACGTSKPASVTEERDKIKVANSNDDKKDETDSDEVAEGDGNETGEEVENGTGETNPQGSGGGETSGNDQPVTPQNTPQNNQQGGGQDATVSGGQGGTQDTTQNTPQTTPEVKNEFVNYNNNTYDVNCVSIKPRHVYWDNGTLVAECFVINGFGHTVYNLNVKSITLGNGSGTIASAAFGGLNGVSIAPYSNIIWTFCFGADTVYMQNADLSYLECNARVSNSY